MGTAADIVLVVIMAVTIAVVAWFFVWAARKDGEQDRDTQRRLGSRRRTRLGR